MLSPCSASALSAKLGLGGRDVARPVRLRPCLRVEGCRRHNQSPAIGLPHPTGAPYFLLLPKERGGQGPCVASRCPRAGWTGGVDARRRGLSALRARPQSRRRGVCVHEAQLANGRPDDLREYLRGEASTSHLPRIAHCLAREDELRHAGARARAALISAWTRGSPRVLSALPFARSSFACRIARSASGSCQRRATLFKVSSRSKSMRTTAGVPRLVTMTWSPARTSSINSRKRWRASLAVR